MLLLQAHDAFKNGFTSYYFNLHQYLLVIFKDLFVGLNTDIGVILYIHPTHSAKDLAECTFTY
jgi:hypothetical protein